MPNNDLINQWFQAGLVYEDPVAQPAAGVGAGLGEDILDVNLGPMVNYLQAGYKKVKKPEEPQQPILEINVAAKEQNPWTMVKTVEELQKYRKEGKYLEYRDYGEIFIPLKASTVLDAGSCKNVLNRGCRVHKRDTTRIVGWVARQRTAWDGKEYESVEPVMFIDINTWQQKKIDLRIVKVLGQLTSIRMEKGMEAGEW
jgi:hypothetical protein